MPRLSPLRALRLAAAHRLLKACPEIGAPLLLDSMSNEAERAYAAHPERLYVIGPDRQVLFKGGKGPFGYQPEELERWLTANL